MKRILFILVTAICTLCVHAKELPEKKFVHPERIKYDGNCFQIEGENTFVYSAAFHYFRVPEALWRDRFQRIKEAGFNTVETYVPWNWHELNMPKSVNDYSQCHFDDLKAWLRMAHEEFDLYTIVRPGPFICAEWAGGAYPRWLAKFCPAKYDTSFWLRSNHPDHLKWAGHWYNAVSPIFAEEQITRKPVGKKGIIMVQLENEFAYFGMESQKKEEVLRTLANNCIRNGIEVPLFTCFTPEVRGSVDPVISQIFDMDNQYIWWNMHESKSSIEKLKRIQPNAPAMVCELQGGWFSTVGGGLSEDNYLDGRHARGMSLMAMAGGATGLNFYMFFGGTHFAGWGARNVTTTYDYGAALKENGGVGEKYAAVKGVGELINRFGSQLATSEPIPYKIENKEDQLTTGLRLAKDGTLFAFFLNRDSKEQFQQNVALTLEGGKQLNIYCQLAARDSRMWVLTPGASQGEWYPKAQEAPKRPTTMPQPIRIASAEKCLEPFTGNWRHLKEGVSLPEIEVNDCRYSLYRSVVQLNKNEVAQYGSLIFELFTEDPLYAQVNGKVVKRASVNELDNTFVLEESLREGENEILVIYENRGHAHGYRPMEELSGLKRAGLGKKQSAVIPIEEWEVKEISPQETTPQLLNSTTGWEKIRLDPKTIANLATLQIAGLAAPEWPAAWVLQGKEGSAVYKTTIHFTPEMLKERCTLIEFGCVDDKGTLWVNGKKVAEHNSWDKPFITNIAKYLQSGDNEIAITVQNNSGAGGLLRGVRLYSELTILKKLKWELSADLGGVVQGFHEGKKGDTQWEKVNLNTSGTIARKGKATPTAEQDGLLTWYRASFNLPAQESGVWMPWRALISASGSGYIWVNGHNIGRYWEEGPQREFYIPECWLNFGRENTLVIGLRQSDTKGALLEGLEILPYYNEAEIR